MPRAVLYDSPGPADVLYVADVDTPAPGDGDVVVTIAAAALNPVDMKMRRGLTPGSTEGEFPKGIGCDFAGVVSSTPDGTTYADGTPVAEGDVVVGWTMGGALREQITIPAAQLARKPADLPMEVAASLPTPGLTAQAAIALLEITADDTVLVSAAAGAVGNLYAQLAARLGARVVGTASAEKQEVLRERGIVAVPYGPGLADRVRAAAPSPITAVQDNHGRETVQAGIDLGVDPQRICTIVDYPAIGEFGIVTTGRYERRADNLQELLDLAAAGELSVPIAQTFALDDVRAAFELLETGHAPGKVVVVP